MLASTALRGIRLSSKRIYWHRKPFFVRWTASMYSSRHWFRTKGSPCISVFFDLVIALVSFNLRSVTTTRIVFLFFDRVSGPSEFIPVNLKNPRAEIDAEVFCTSAFRDHAQRHEQPNYLKFDWRYVRRSGRRNFLKSFVYASLTLGYSASDSNVLHSKCAFRAIPAPVVVYSRHFLMFKLEGRFGQQGILIHSYRLALQPGDNTCFWLVWRWLNPWMEVQLSSSSVPTVRPH